MHVHVCLILCVCVGGVVGLFLWGGIVFVQSLGRDLHARIGVTGQVKD